MAEKNKYTPMMQHYLQMKKESARSVFYRAGDYMRCFLMTRRLRRWSSTLC